MMAAHYCGLFKLTAYKVSNITGNVYNILWNVYSHYLFSLCLYRLVVMPPKCADRKTGYYKLSNCL